MWLNGGIAVGRAFCVAASSSVRIGLFGERIPILEPVHTQMVCELDLLWDGKNAIEVCIFKKPALTIVNVNSTAPIIGF
jgi:hypothetical protein